MSALKGWVARAVLALFAASVVALAYAPHVPRLIRESYPQSTWPAPGSYAQVAGALQPSIRTAHTLAEPNAALKSLFDDSGGRALLAAYDGKLILEHYAPGFSRDTMLNSYSLVKSLIGALALKAIADGKFKSRDMTLGAVLDGLPNGAASAANIPLCRLLDMTSGIQIQADRSKQASGFDVKDFETTNWNLLGPMGRLHMLGLDGVRDKLVTNLINDETDCETGTYSYQNANTALVGAALERAYGQPLEQVLADKIWVPAGAAPGQWRRYGTDAPVTPYCCLYARPVDWLKVAIFLSSNGTAERPFLPADVWQQFIGNDLNATQRTRGTYRNFAFHNTLDRTGEPLAGPFTYFMGSQGQMVYLMPTANLTVVRFGTSFQKLHSTLYEIERSIGGLHKADAKQQ